jgi:putative CocE/NonD family hydrolase
MRGSGASDGVLVDEYSSQEHDDARRHPYIAARGYACARVDMRGSGASDGVLVDEYSSQEHDDAVEVIAWLAEQPWCTGAIGMTGISWSGFNSLQVAARRPPALKAIITACSTDDRYADDVHYLGGVPLACYLLTWACALMGFNARAPDPKVAGERWRDLWLERLERNTDLIGLWLEHQSRDDYWRHGSICEDYGAIECAVLAVGGWADAYVDAILRMLANLQCPRMGLIGPWGHLWPQDGRPGPAIGFLQESIRWWDHWLKGKDTGITDEPMLRAYMQDSVAPAADYVERPGRWVAERSWPRTEPPLTLYLGETGLDTTPPRNSALTTHCSAQTVGLDGGAFCAYGNPADFATDQRRDDALSLCFDGEPLEHKIELLGQPAVRLTVASDRPSAFVFARICDVAPDGSSTLITRGVLNLCHSRGHDQPEPLVPGVPVEVTIPLRSVGYAVPAAHRLRLALSTCYWPWMWPSPEPVTITVRTGGGAQLLLPARTPHPQDRELKPFEPPAHASPLPVVALRARQPEHLIRHDPATGELTVRIRRDFGGGQRLPSGMEYSEYDPTTLTIHDDDPLSAKAVCERRIEMRRGEWSTRIELKSTMTCTAHDYRLSTLIDAYERDTRVHTRAFARTIPRHYT